MKSKTRTLYQVSIERKNKLSVIPFEVIEYKTYYKVASITYGICKTIIYKSLIGNVEKNMIVYGTSEVEALYALYETINEINEQLNQRLIENTGIKASIENRIDKLETRDGLPKVI